MALSVGALSGMAYKHPFYQDLQAELEMRKMDEVKKAQAFQEAQYLAKAYERGKASSPYFQQMLNQHSEGVIKQMGKFMRENPDWKYNPEKFMQFSALSDSLRNNTWTQRSENLIAQTAALNEAYQKNPNLMKQKAFRDQFVQVSNLRNTGSIDGIPENGQDYTFTPVQPWEDPMKLLADYANTNLLNRDYVQEGGWVVSKIPQAELDFATKTIGSLHQELFESYAKEAGVTLEEYVRNGLMMAGKNNAKILPSKASGRAGARGAGGAGAADPTVATSRFNTEIINGAVGDLVNAKFSQTMRGQAPVLMIDTPTGGVKNLGSRTIVSVDSIGADYKDPVTGRIKKTFNVTTVMPLQEAQEAGLITDPYMPWSSPEVAAGQKGVRITQNEKGEDIAFVTARLPFDINDKGIASTYNEAARGLEDKGVANSTNMQAFQDKTTGEVFYYNEADGTWISASDNYKVEVTNNPYAGMSTYQTGYNQMSKAE